MSLKGTVYPGQQIITGMTLLLCLNSIKILLLNRDIFNILDVNKVSALIDTSKENPEIHLGQLAITDQDMIKVSKTFSVRSNHISNMNT